ncbi:efflux RND transporter periplasmic adaptor subunit [Cytobacillus gottheilii]|uniref:efflux RND transporter periplasmic adaptor subunit n=1 Tax=Cytobacillus gottheilii TaxID=859144 RepID=UPI0009BA3D04|nr:efflux RND transporter periplasmic adaptor subunit [Cytobacillus gottheilii]
MRKRGISTALIIITLLFLGVNTFLIVKSDSKIQRISYVEEWTSPFERDLQKKLSSEGVIVSSVETPVYHDQNKGVINELLVQEGEEVTIGSPLFTYINDDLNFENSKLEIELEKLEEELEAVETNIDQLEDLLDDAQTAAAPSDENVENRDNEFEIQRELLEKERLFSILESDISKLEKLLDQEADREDLLTAESPADGIIQSINVDLGDPFITIISTEQKVETTLTESERKEVEVGMPVYIRGQNTEMLEGSVGEVSLIPTDKPEVGKESNYPVDIFITDEMEETPFGTKVNLEIVTDEVNQTLAIPTVGIKKAALNAVYTLTATGKVEKRMIERGLHVNGLQEISDGLQSNDFIVKTGGRNIQDGRTFITPLRIENVSKTQMENMERNQILKAIGKGFLSH